MKPIKYETALLLREKMLSHNFSIYGEYAYCLNTNELVRYIQNNTFAVGDKNIFYPDNELKYNGGKFKIVTHHWSNNWMKGFKVYQSVDDMIYNNEIKDFELMVIGRWPEEIKWKSIIINTVQNKFKY